MQWSVLFGSWYGALFVEFPEFFALSQILTSDWLSPFSCCLCFPKLLIYEAALNWFSAPTHCFQITVKMYNITKFRSMTEYQCFAYTVLGYNLCIALNVHLNFEMLPCIFLCIFSCDIIHVLCDEQLLPIILHFNPESCGASVLRTVSFLICNQNHVIMDQQWSIVSIMIEFTKGLYSE